MKTLALAVLATFALTRPASAQNTDPDLPDLSEFEDDGETTEMPVDDSEPVPFEEEGASPSGSEEDPDAPTVSASSSADDTGTTGGEYDQLAQRPITLPSAAGQLRWFGGVGGLTEKRAYKYRAESNFLRAGGVLSAQYGITDQIQLGIHYGTGTYGDTALPPAAKDKEYVSGKAASIEFHYRLYEWVALQVELPMLLDPFEMGLTIGAPMKFRFGDSLAIFLLEDLFTVRFTDMVPFVEDSVSNARALAGLDASVEQDSGDITVKGGVIYQLSPKAALRGTFGIVAADFEMGDGGTVLWGDLVYSLSKRLDLEARTGFANIAEPGDTFTLAVGAAYRI